MELSLSEEQHGDLTVVKVAGEVDVYTAPKLRDKIMDVVSKGRHDLVIDLGRVEFLDSTGLGVLVGGVKRVRSQDGSLALVCDKEQILKVLRITGLTKVFPIYDTLEEALEGQR